jgi:hypothetical protein
MRNARLLILTGLIAMPVVAQQITVPADITDSSALPPS